MSIKYESPGLNMAHDVFGVLKHMMMVGLCGWTIMTI